MELVAFKYAWMLVRHRGSITGLYQLHALEVCF